MLPTNILTIVMLFILGYQVIYIHIILYKEPRGIYVARSTTLPSAHQFAIVASVERSCFKYLLVEVSSIVCSSGRNNWF